MKNENIGLLNDQQDPQSLQSTASNVQDVSGLQSLQLTAPNAQQVALVMKYFPLVSSALFTAAMDPKKLEQFAFAGSMLAATTLPVVADLVNLRNKLSDRQRHLIETMSSSFMIVAVAFMAMGAIENVEKSASAKVGLSAVACFSVFAMLNMGYNLLKLLGIIKGDKPLVQLISSGSGLVGSILFLTAQVMNYVAANESGNKANMNAAGLLSGASLGFIAATGHGVFAAAQGLRKSLQEVDVLQTSIHEYGYTPV